MEILKGFFQCKLVYSTYFWKIYNKIVILGQRMVTVSRLTQNNQTVDTTHITHYGWNPKKVNYKIHRKILGSKHTYRRTNMYT